MHISDGFLSPPVCAATGAVAAGAVGWGLRKLQSTPNLRTVPLTALMAGLIFAGQMVNFRLPLPVAVSGHLIGGVLAAAVLGPWGGLIALSLVLFVQMLLFADGGWLTYGANVLNMGVVGSLGGYFIFDLIRRRISGPRGVVVAAVIASWLSVVAASTVFCVEFAISPPAALVGENSKYGLGTLLTLMTSFHSVIGVGEALITGLILSYVVAVRPDLIYNPQSSSPWIPNISRVLWTGAIAALVVAAFAAPFASEAEDGLEAVGTELSIKPEGEPRKVVLDDYKIPLPGVDIETGLWGKVSTALAGIFGTGCVVALALIFSRVVGPKPTLEAPHGP